MNTVGIKKAAFAAITVPACLIMLAGCAFMRQTASVSQTAAPAMQSFTDPTFELETAAPVELVSNPVTAMYDAREADTAAALAQFKSKLSASSTIAEMEAVMLLFDHEALLSKARVSIGRMTSSGSYYSESLIGAATGYGTMSSSNGFYEFRFAYDSGDSLCGTLEGDRLDFGIELLSGESAAVSLFHSGNAWFSAVNSGDIMSILEIRGGFVRFGFFVPNEVTPTPTLRPTPTPTPELDEEGIVIERTPEITPRPTLEPFSFASLLVEYPDMTVFDSILRPAPEETPEE